MKDVYKCYDCPDDRPCKLIIPYTGKGNKPAQPVNCIYTTHEKDDYCNWIFIKTKE